MWTLQTFLRRLIWACMAPLLALALIELAVNLHKSQAQLDADLERHARLTQQYLDLKLGAYAQGLNMLAISPHLRDAGGAADFYNEAQTFQLNFGAHVVLADQARLLMHTRLPFGAAMPPRPQFAGRSGVTGALATGQAAMSDLFEGAVSKTPLLAMAVPLAFPERTGQVLSVTIEAVRLEQHLRDIFLPEGVRALLLDSTGRPIAARGTIDPAVPPALFGKRLILPLSLTPWSLIVEADGAAQRAMFFKDAALWLTALTLAAGAAYLAARRAGKSLEDGLGSLAASSTRHPARHDIVEVAQVRDRLLQLNQQRDQQEAELRQLLTQIGQTQELERKRIALDIHDDLQQTLAALKLSAVALSKADEDDQQALRRQLAQAIDQQASQAVQSTRRIIDDLRPQVLDNLGLEAALESLVARFGRETGVEAIFQAVSADGGELSVEPGLAIALYRVAQEALNNVRKHAQARTVEVRFMQDVDGQLALRVTDDGRGLPQPPAPGLPGAGTGQAGGAGAAPPRGAASGSGLGLAGMRERMCAMGGTLELRPAQGGGTEVVARAPMGSGAAG